MGNGFYSDYLIFLFIKIDVINKMTQTISIVFHNSRPSAILKIGFINIADESQIENQILFIR